MKLHKFIELESACNCNTFSHVCLSSSLKRSPQLFIRISAMKMQNARMKKKKR